MYAFASPTGLTPLGPMETLRILAIGDAIGRPGRRAVRDLVPAWRRDGRADFVIVNGENSAHGKGITRDCARDLFESGADVITAGNHIWDNKGVFEFIAGEPRLIRPANYGEGGVPPGRGFGVFDVVGRPGVRVGVTNLLGQVHMAPLGCPFTLADAIVPALRAETPIVVVDFHAEATSEKVAMGWHLDGRASLVYGTHTHVPTADNRVLPGGTAYITDLGMTGGYAGVIGVTSGPVLHRFTTKMPVKHEVAEDDVHLSGVLAVVDVATGRAVSVERVFEPGW